MKMKTNFARLNSLVALAAGVLLAGHSPAQSLTFVPSVPIPTNSDIYNFTGSLVDADNVSDGGTYADGGANDGFTYVANGRPDQGQTFTTGPTAGTVTAIWIRHVGYTNEAPSTFWSFSAGSAFTFRITNPSAGGHGGIRH